jgi:ubiquinone/menaquinone biosynthesis C-methylase UbiE
MTKDSTQRFSNRVQNYIKYRPDYPPEVLAYLRERTGLSEASTVADIGAGTGIFTKHLLNLGCKVYAIEPNTEMREAADAMLKGSYPDKYISINAPADNTSLKDHSIDLIVCAQAFHWFNTGEARTEFHRVLKPSAQAALIWNNRQVNTDDFSKDYDQLLREKTADYNEVNHQKLSPADFEAFFKEGKYEKRIFPSYQEFDEAGFLGRANSSSYVPAGDAVFQQLLKDIFQRHQVNGMVKFYYDTEVYSGEV